MKRFANELIPMQIELEAFEMQRRLGAMLASEGFPKQSLAVERIEGAIAFLIDPKAHSLEGYNHALVQGLSPAGLKRLLSLYQERGIRPWFFLSPSETKADLLKEFAKSDYSLSGLKNVLWKDLSEPEPAPSKSPDPEVRIAPAASLREVLAAAPLYEERKKVPFTDFTHFLAPWMEPGESSLLFIAKIGDEVAGAGLLSWHKTSGGRAAMLSSGAAAERFSGRGVQRALIRARLDKAREMGCEVAFAPHVSALIPSEANLIRSGFRILYPRALMHPIDEA